MEGCKITTVSFVTGTQLHSSLLPSSPIFQPFALFRQVALVGGGEIEVSCKAMENDNKLEPRLLGWWCHISRLRWDQCNQDDSCFGSAAGDRLKQWWMAKAKTALSKTASSYNS